MGAFPTKTKYHADNSHIVNYGMITLSDINCDVNHQCIVSNRADKSVKAALNHQVGAQ